MRQSNPTFEPLGVMRVNLAEVDPKIGVTVEGAPESVAYLIPWGPLIEFAIKLADHFGVGGGAGAGPSKGTGCITTVTTLPDGSSVTTKYCPPPA